ncbi:unconventional myosin-XV [Callorhinchus milii]|uniref:unconventional myosin-XV n=1 Tax=Callorhinchus milii TaxID=7868 RepID=UPI001C3FDCDF|nr:unconventional myosin-XV [Callorhinchus milii]
MYQRPPDQTTTGLSVYRQENGAGRRPQGYTRHKVGDQEWEEDNEKGMPWFNKMYSIGDQLAVRFQQPLEETGVDDMTQLEDLNEGAVLYNLRKRFDLQIIYTYIGSILVSVNPYKMYNLYGTETVLRYEGKSLGENPPHLFAIANAAYSKMIDAKHNQCIIISGESGSGKTEATKLILRYLAAIHHKRRDNATQQILEATPLLESFGNAKTVRNDNSSRFGKYIEIFLEDGVICGAITSQYLLEKSRIVFQAKNERNYHIFYELLAGLSSQQKQRFYLQEAETYYYLNQGGNCEIPGKQDGEDFRRLLSAMEVLGFSSEEQSGIFRILSSVLHLGNVYFEKYETDSQEIASVVSAREIRVVAELLQISPEGLQKSITYKVTETMREKIFTPLTVESAVDARDAVAKILYSLLFSWLTDRINKLVSPRTESLSIAILDIYGFEDLSINSFEQLCINYANEYLQYFFNKIVFKVEQEEYMREQIDWKEITFSNNQPCLDLISQRPHGILRVLDDQSCFPQATDHTFLQKCHYHHSNSPLYSKPKMPLPEFTIKHFAGKVTYQVHKFLEKNHDQVRQEVLELFVSSRTRMLVSLFSGHAVKAMPMKSSTITRRYQAPTVAAKFQQSLMELVEKMERCNPFFVRCFKPNNKKEMDLFELDLVSAQLRYSGVLETIRIRKEGFPVRIPFATFIKRYKILLGLTQEIKADGENCVTILKQICPVNKGMYRIGLTKLFMKENLHHILDSKRDRLMKIAALTLQRYARGFLARKHYNVLRHKIILLQAQARGYLARKKYQKVKESLLKVKSVVQAYVNRKRFLRMREEARRLAEQEHQRLQMELTKREVVSVTHLDIPAELAGLLHALPVQSEDSVGQVESPKVQAEEQLTLVLDINNYPFSKFVRLHFKEPLLGMLTSPLDEPLTQVEEDLKPEAVNVFRLILRFMGDPHLNGIQENLFGNYILQIGLANPGLRDEIFSQIANQVWRNTNKNNAERGWLLLATCLSCFAPSPKMDKYLLKFVSDYAHTGFKAMCQHKLMQALRKAGDGSDAARTYPPCLLEWTANKKGASMAMHISCLDGVKLLGPVSCWTTGEELAQDILRHRGAVEGCRGWSVVRKDRGEWAELAGHDYVMDLVSDLELMPDFPKQKSYFLISSESPARRKVNGNVVFGNGLDSDDDIPPFPSTKAPTELPPGTPDPDENYSGSLRQDLDSRSQKGLDRYLDSLFDPLLSYGNGDLEKTSSVSNRLKGGGKVGAGDADREERSSGPEVQTPGGQTVMPMMPAMGAAMPGIQPVPFVPVYDQNQFLSQQQAFINHQAYLLAQQMTVQALALQQQMTVSNPSLTPSLGISMGKLSSGNVSPHTGAANGGLALTGVRPDTAQGKPTLKSSPTPYSKPSALKPEHVHHTKLNCQHIVEPTHNIKDIIKQHQQPPEALRKEGGKVFAKKVDPHEEAMLILKDRLPPHVPQKAAPSLPQEKVAKEMVAMVKPVSSSKLKHSGPPVPAGAGRHPALAGALISRELGAEDEMIQTQLHRPCCQEYYTYCGPAWELYIRKEVLYPKDNVSSPVLLDLIFRQILSDALSDTCVRISKEEQLRMRSLLAENKIQASTPVKEEAVKRKIVLAARDVWEVYFSRLFPATGSVGTGVQLLAVSHRGVHLLKLVRSRGATGENVKVLRSYSYADVLFVTIPSKNMLEFNLTNEKLILFSSKAPQVKSMIDHFITELKKDSNYVVAVKSYMASESSAMLSFHKGDIIRLQPMEGVEEGYCYGCIVRKKVVYMEELKRYTPDFGWKFGAFHGRSGLFPVEFVQPVAAPDFIHLSVDKKEEPKDKRGKVAVSSTVAAAVASTAAAEELDRKIEVSPLASERMGGVSDYVDNVIPDSQYTMSEFASKYFREARRLKVDYNKQKSKKGKDSREPTDMMKYTKSPIQESLIEFSDENMNKVAAEIFAVVMKFMGDSPLKGQTEQDAIYTVLKLCREHEVMKDEAYCQIIKQVTNNTSSKVDSSLRGWRMLYILSAHHKCSEVLKPYLYKFLEDVCRSSGANFQGIAHACEQNLRKTFQFGGRTQYPGGMEFKAMLAGRSSKRQLFLLPGSVERHVKIKTCSVALDVIEELCYEMGLHSPEAVEEYSLFVITNKGQNVHPLNRKDYILDVATEMEAIDSNFTFWFRRLIWAQPLKFDNELCVTVHYNQVVPDYLKGLLHILTQERRSEQQLQQVSKLAALQHRAKDGVYLPSVREVQEYVPPQIYWQQRPQLWLNMVTDHTQQVQALSAHQARAQFLGLVSIFPMFGSSFFFIQSSSNSAIDTPCILAINQNGLSFLNKDTHELMVNFPLKQVQSTRTQRLATGSSYPYVEIKLGDLMSQRTTQLQLNQALDMCRVIAVHVESILTAREKRLTLPPSEITLL